MKVLESKKVTKVYDAFKGAQAIKALNDISFKVEEKEFFRGNGSKRKW